VSAESLLQLLTGGAGAVAVLGIFLGLIVAGKLHTDEEMKRADQLAELRSEALKTEQAAHAETRRALADAAARADAAVRASEMIADAFSAASTGSGHHVPS
jgi:hypothetical protein